AVTNEPSSLRDEGRRRVLQALYENGACRRADLIRLTALSRSTVSSLVAELAASGIVEEHPAPSRAGGLRDIGRPAVVVSMAPDAGYAVGVDIGHEHVRVAVCGLGGNAVAESESRREVDLAPQETLDLAADQVTHALTEHNIDPGAVIGLGLGIAAPVPTGSGRIEASGIMPGWVGVNPVDEMHVRTGLDVRVINDADAGALGEHTYGAARGVDDLLYVRLSAGIGAAVIAGRRPLRGSAGLAGELGHVHAVENGPICRCGNRGCLETVASPVAIAHLLSQSWHRPVTSQELMQLVDDGDPGARRAVEDAATHVGLAIAAAVNLLNPQLVVIGGDLAHAGELLLQPVRTAIRRAVLPATAAQVTVVCGQLGEHAEVLGAASLALADMPRRLNSRARMGGLAGRSV
ncbi:MAG TPA: ROK family transcriptional regulator, partial [Streptosporangiaceae bacterium]